MTVALSIAAMQAFRKFDVLSSGPACVLAFMAWIVPALRSHSALVYF